MVHTRQAVLISKSPRVITRLIRRALRKIKKRKHPILLLIILFQLIFPQHVAAEANAQADSVDPITIAFEKYSTDVDGNHLPDTAARQAQHTRWVTLTAYSSTVDQTDGDPFTTASGAKVHDGVIAMNGVPFGTKVRFPEVYGDKVFTVLDRMNARYGSTIADQWMETREAAIQWGARVVKMEIL